MAIIDFSAGGRDYKLVTYTQNAVSAALNSKSLGGYLVNLETEEESALVYQAIKALVDSGQVDINQSRAADGGDAAYVWLGGTDNVWSGFEGSAEGNWRWKESGTSLSVQRSEWGSGALGAEPDNFNGDQNYLALGLENWPTGSADGAGFGNAGSWNDINGSNLLFYIVEMSPLVDNSASSSVENSIINGRQYLSNEVQSLSRQENIDLALLGGDDFLEVTGGIANYANGNQGADHIVIRGGKGQYLGGRNDDTIEVFSALAGTKVNGNKGIDLIVGSAFGVEYRGGQDDDLIQVSAGTVFGDKGADTFQAVAGEGIAIVQDYTAGEDVIRGFAGGSLTASADGLIYGTGDDQMLLLAGIDSLAQVSIV